MAKRKNKKKSSEVELMTSVSVMIDFIKSQTKNDISKCVQEKYITIEQTDVERLFNILDASITSSFTKSSTEVINAIRNIEARNE